MMFSRPSLVLENQKEMKNIVAMSAHMNQVGLQ